MSSEKLNQLSNIEERLGKYFLIASKSQPDLVLEVKDGTNKPNVQIVVGLLKDETEALNHQLWFWDVITSTIRSGLNGYYIGINAEEKLIVQPFENPSNVQSWDIQQDSIIIEKDFENVFTLNDSDLHPGALCHVTPYDGLVGQLWKFIYLPATFFFIRNKAMNKVLDIRGESASVGAQLITYAQKDSFDDNQLWYEDQNGLIHSKMHDFIINVLNDNIVMYPYNENTRKQQWIRKGPLLLNRNKPNHVLDVKQDMLKSYGNVVLADFNSSSKSQEWSFENVSVKAYAFDHNGKGPYFLIQQSYFEVVLTIKDQSLLMGATPPYEIALSKLNFKDNGMFSDEQLFYLDHTEGTIRFKLNKRLCLEVKDSYLYLSSYEPGNENQQFVINDRKIHLKSNDRNILTIGTNDETTSPMDMQCYMAEDYESHHQIWNLRYGSGIAFYIMAKLSGKVLEVRRDNYFKSCAVVLADQKAHTRSASQLWYEDEVGLIRSKLNGFAFDTTSGSLHIDRFDSMNSNQGWVRSKEHIRNKYNGLVFDVTAQKKWIGTSVGPAEIDYSDNQRWIFSFV